MTRGSLAVVGGGLTGVVVAALAADAGARVTLVESTDRLGGRAAGMPHPFAPVPLYSICPTFLRGSNRLAAFLARIGASAAVTVPERWELWLMSEGGVTRLGPRARWPGRLGVLAWALGQAALSGMERVALARGLWRLARPDPELRWCQSFRGWLEVAGQPARLVTRFWDPLCVLATGHSSSVVAPELAHRSLGRLVSAGSGAGPGWPSGDLADVLGTRARSFIQSRGGLVRPGQAATRLVVVGGRVRGVELASGEIVHADEYVLALSPAGAARLLPESAAGREALVGVGSLVHGAMHSVHLWSPPSSRPAPAVVLAAGEPLLTIHTRPGGPGGQTTSVYWTEAGEFSSIPTDEWAALVTRRLGRGAGWAPGTGVDRTLALTEENAVFAPTSKAVAARPGPRTELGHLWLAGEWIAGVEGAGLEGQAEGAFCAVRALAQGRPDMFGNLGDLTSVVG